MTLHDNQTHVLTFSGSRPLAKLRTQDDHIFATGRRFKP